MGQVLAVAAVVAGLSLAWASPASAHQIDLRLGGNTGYVVNHETVWAFDNECDGNYVRIYYEVSTIGGTVPYYATDTNGCNPGGATYNHHPQRVTRARLCELNVACTPWKSVT